MIEFTCGLFINWGHKAGRLWKLGLGVASFVRLQFVSVNPPNQLVQSPGTWPLHVSIGSVQMPEILLCSAETSTKGVPT